MHQKNIFTFTQVSLKIVDTEDRSAKRCCEMEITNVPKIPAQKAEETQQEKRVPPKVGSNAYAADKAKDSADISSKARQMLSLREAFKKLDTKEEAKLQDIKENLEEGVHKLSSEEIVSSILQGTLFEVV